MSISRTNLIKFIEEIAPKNLEEPWDNSGVQVGLRKGSVNRICISLDLTKEILLFAKNKNCDFVLTHHPYLMSDEFESKNVKLNKKIEIKNILKNKDVLIYAAHTTFDNSKYGHNFLFPHFLEKEKIIKLKNNKNKNTNSNSVFGINKAKKKNEKENLIGSYFLIDEISFELFLKKLKKLFNVNVLPVVLGKNKQNKKIRRIAFCGGSGSYNLDKLDFSLVDLYITSDIKYHTALDFSKEKMPIILDLTHYFSEILFCTLMNDYIGNEFKNEVEIFTYNKSLQPIKYM